MDLVTLVSKSSSSYTTHRQTYARWRIFVPVKGSVQIVSSITLTSVTWFHGVSRAFLCPLCVPTGVGAGVIRSMGGSFVSGGSMMDFAANFSPGLESSYWWRLCRKLGFFDLLWVMPIMGLIFLLCSGLRACICSGLCACYCSGLCACYC